MYGNEASDVTDMVIKELNAIYGSKDNTVKTDPTTPVTDDVKS